MGAGGPEGSPDPDVTEQLVEFLERTSDLVGVVDQESRVRYLNEAARKRLGVGAVTGLTTADLFPPSAFARYYDEIRPALLRRGSWAGELAVRTEAGEVPVAMTIVGWVGPGGEVQTLVTSAREIDAPAAGVAEGAGLVHDELTGLPGRVILDDRMRVALAHAARDRGGVAAILVDVDAMKDVNDSFGHAAGDRVLQRIAGMMVDAVRTSDTVARVGGDEFVVLLDGLECVDTAWQITERLRDALCEDPVEHDEAEPAVTASFGLAVANPEDSPDELLRRADAAMYRAKALGGANATVFEGGAEVQLTRLADELAVAVSHGQIRPHVQSVVDLRTGAVVGYQGLARWEHPQRGLLDAEEFVPFAAGTPVLPVIDLAVLRRTAVTAAHGGDTDVPVHVYAHLSRRLLGDSGIERYLTELLDDLGIDAADLRIEIAHTLVNRPSRTVESTLRGLREFGARIVLTGVDGECDVNEIVEYGFDELRLHRRLVHDARHDPTRRRVADGTIALARALGLTVIAVGVESAADRDRLRDAGCDYGQGNLFGPVRPAGPGGQPASV
jgi:diguanylate cyclase (GGDEF)-like protein